MQARCCSVSEEELEKKVLAMNRDFDSRNLVSVGDICLLTWFISLFHYLLNSDCNKGT